MVQKLEKQTFLAFCNSRGVQLSFLFVHQDMAGPFQYQFRGYLESIYKI